VEPAQTAYFLSEAVAVGVPFVAFFLGVAVSVVLNLNEDTPKLHVFVMGVPVSAVLIGTLLTTTNVTFTMPNGIDIDKYGHMSSVPEFLLFCGTIMFYGTLTPQLFHLNRRRITKIEEARAKAEIEALEGHEDQ